MNSPDPINAEALLERATALSLPGLVAHWDDLEPPQLAWLATLIEWEETERRRRGLERRLRHAHLGRFKALADFDWAWPTHCDRSAVSEMMTLGFLRDATNLILLGNNGLGKSTLALNIAHQAVLEGHSALFVNAGEMLGDLAGRDGDSALHRRLKHYARPDVLVIDELGYLSYGTRHADLLFDIVNRRYEQKSTIVTTNKAFKEWGEVFPNAGCVVSLVDRLVHHSQILLIEGESYRMHEAKQRAATKQRKRPSRAKSGKLSTQDAS